MEPVVLIDIDGTLSDCGHRRDLVNGEKKDWGAFFARMTEDAPNAWCVLLMNALSSAGIPLYLVSGRPDDYRERTLSWLTFNHIPFRELYMRSSGDSRDDTVVKAELYDRHVRDKFKVSFVVDDRPSVCDMWRQKGLTVLQCADPSSPF
jgi:hypothetical protein